MNHQATDADIDEIERQAEHFGCVKIHVSSRNFDRPLPARWFYPLASAGIDVRVTDDADVGIGFVHLRKAMVWWLDVWGDG